MTDLLFEESPYQPLAAKVRPRSLDEYIGQSHILAPAMPLRQAIDSGQLHSMLLWGPPGTGKTTLARLLANLADAHFETLSAVLGGVKDIRQAVEIARQHRAQSGRRTILFIDEVHRFNKAQQDAFLPHIEDGTILFVGATTENPSFELNNALLSRCRVYVLRSLEEEDLYQILQQAIEDPRAEYPAGVINQEQLHTLARAADGDARKALNLLEITLDLARQSSGEYIITQQTLAEVLQGDLRRFDKGGDAFYEQISALHKAVRGSSPDGALYWFARMLDGGCDPLYIARRVVRMASEDIGNADPRALSLAISAWDTQTRLGSPEGELAIAQAVVYLACAAKSNAVYSAFNAVMEEVRNGGSLDVPIHLRNAPTALMKDLDYGGEYRYSHDEPNAYSAGENYLPKELADKHWYQPVERGLEKKIAEKLQYLAELDAQSEQQRYKGSLE
ncbi:MAG: replication-associated recombination protein A [Pseudomonadales bacterium]